MRGTDGNQNDREARENPPKYQFRPSRERASDRRATCRAEMGEPLQDFITIVKTKTYEGKSKNAPRLRRCDGAKGP